MKPKQTSDAGVFCVSKWINHGKRFSSAPIYVHAALTDFLAIPSPLEKVLFPMASAPVGSALRTPAASVPIWTTAGTSLDSVAYNLSEFFTTTPPIPLVPMDVFRTMPIPPSEVTEDLLRMVGQQWLDGSVSIRARHLVSSAKGPEVFLPLYILKVWQRIHQLRPLLLGWLRAENWLLNLRPLGNIVADTRHLLSKIPWYARIQGLDAEPDTPFLTTYLSRDWLASDHINAFLEVLQAEVNGVAGIKRDTHCVRHTFFTQILGSHYTQACNNDTLLPPEHVLPDWMIADRDAHAAGHLSSLGLVFNLNNNHWVAAVIDLSNQTILYADSLQSPIPPQLVAQLHWWLSLFSPTPYNIVTLPCTTQGLMDSYSCGLLSSNALAHHYLPEAHPLIPASDVDAGRMDMLRRIWKHSERHVSGPKHVKYAVKKD